LQRRFELPPHRKATTDKNYTTFLKYFGEFKVAAVATREVSGHEYIIEEMKIIKSMLRDIAIRNRSNPHRYPGNRGAHSGAVVTIKNIREEAVEELLNVMPSVGLGGFQYNGKDLTLHFDSTSKFDELLDIEEILNNTLKSMNINPQISVAWS
jgi:hypothetical protein